MKKVSNIPDVFKLLGSNVEVAKLLKITPSGVSEMKRNNRIGVRYWPAILSAAANAEPNDLSMEKLATISAKAASRKRSKAKVSEQVREAQ